MSDNTITVNDVTVTYDWLRENVVLDEAVFEEMLTSGMYGPYTEEMVQAMAGASAIIGALIEVADPKE